MGASLTKAERRAIPPEDFAVPDKRALPLIDERHLRMGWSQIGRVAGLSPEERTDGRLRILAKAREMGIATDTYDHIDNLQLQAMALEMPDVGDHPNKMPFAGVLVKLDEPSTVAPHGSNGKRVLMTAAAAEEALPSLLGMAVDFTPEFDGHDVRQKIGVITGATIENLDLNIEGFIYASDFPAEAATIKRDKNVLGFSFEAQQIHVESLDGDPLIITACVFTGAAILKKLKAAYTTTSLAASAAGDIEMTKEELETVLASALAPVTAKITALEAGQTELTGKIEAGKELQAKVAPFADKLRSTADDMKAAGIGAHATRGHAAILHRMADNMEAEAMGGSMPNIYRDTDYGSGMYASAEPVASVIPVADPKVTALEARVADLTTKLETGIAAARDATVPPERKTVSPQIGALLAKAGVEAPTDGKKIGGETLDKVMAGMSISDRLRKKAELYADGMID